MIRFPARSLNEPMSKAGYVASIKEKSQCIEYLNSGIRNLAIAQGREKNVTGKKMRYEHVLSTGFWRGGGIRNKIKKLKIKRGVFGLKVSLFLFFI